MSTVLKKTKLTFSISKGNVVFKESYNYTLGDGATSVDSFPGECPLDSEHLEDWIKNVTTGWLQQKSARSDATVLDTDEEKD